MQAIKRKLSRRRRIAATERRTGHVLGANTQSDDFREIIGSHGTGLIALAHPMHAQSRGVILRQSRGDDPLTDREADGLSCIARGAPDRVADLMCSEPQRWTAGSWRLRL
mgnify:FL=1